MFYLLGELQMQIFNKEIDLTCGMRMLDVQRHL